MRATYTTWRVWTGAVAAMLTATAPAHAFYWYDWPGSGLQVQTTLLTAPHQNSSANPPSTVTNTSFPNPPGAVHVPAPPVGPPVPVGGKSPDGPSSTPEPATGVLGLMGLGAFAIARRFRKKM